MGIFSNRLEREVRLERMRPWEVDEAKAKQPAIYVPFGSIEWHGYHNPVGLDAIKAHEILVGLALRVGGVVYPPVFFGSGGGHTEWPSTFMVDAEPMVRIVTELLQGFERDGYEKAILFSGHYPNHPEYQVKAVEAYRKAGGTMRVLSLIEDQIPDGKGDHASKYETSLMLYLHPDTVDRDALKVGPDEELTGPDEIVNWMEEKYKDHPNYGLVGIDPRAYASEELGKELTERLIRYFAEWLRAEV
jgi:creatinine amidohydrolase